MKTPILVINFKTYKKGSNDDAVKMARLCDRIAREKKANIAIAVQALDLYRVAKEVEIPVFIQHIDNIDYGANTGHIVPAAAKEYGASGCVINHSEDSVDLLKIEGTIKKAREIGLTSLVCAPLPEIAAEITKYQPDLIAFEPPELIGSETSVSDAEPEIIAEAVKDVKDVFDIPVLCGAGIKSRHDVEVAIDLGSAGVFVASHIVKADNPEKKIIELVEGLDGSKGNN